MEGGDNQTMLIVVALVGFCCLVSAGAGLYIYFNDDANAWFKKTFGIGDDAGPAPEPDAAEGDAAPTPEDPMTPPEDPAPTPEEDVDEPSGSGADEDCEANGSCSRKGSSPAYFCRYPWKDGKYVNFDKQGKTPRCCPSGTSNYRTQCKPSLVNAMASGVKQSAADIARDNLMKLRDKYKAPKWKKNGPRTCICDPNAVSAVYKINANKGEACINLKNGKISVYANTEKCNNKTGV